MSVVKYSRFRPKSFVSTNLPTERLTVDIYDAVGRLVLTKDFGLNLEYFTTDMNLESLESGAYMVVVTNGTSTTTERLIKQ